MTYLLKLEELAEFGLSLYFFSLTDLAWWWYPALILAPDLGMLGYIISARAGAFSYNFLHHKGLAIGLYLLGLYFGHTWLVCAGLVMFGHAALDRVLGYGLKYGDQFGHTHLGWIGVTPEEDTR